MGVIKPVYFPDKIVGRLFEHLAHLAEQDKVSVNSLCVKAIVDYVDSRIVLIQSSMDDYAVPETPQLEEKTETAVQLSKLERDPDYAKWKSNLRR